MRNKSRHCTPTDSAQGMDQFIGDVVGDPGCVELDEMATIEASVAQDL